MQKNFLQIFYRYFFRLLLPGLLLVNCEANANGFYISADLGTTKPEESTFDYSELYRLAAGYQVGKLGLEMSIMDLDKMEHNDLSNSYVEIKGFTTHVYWHQKFNKVLGIDLGAGIFSWEADATLLNYEAGNDSDTSPYYDVRLIAEFGTFISIHAATRYFKDVSGTDINSLSTGISVHF